MEVLDRVEAMELSTIEGRRDAAAALAAVPRHYGRSLWSMLVPGTRFPEGWDDVYVTEFDKVVLRQMTQLRTQLTIQRETSIAKDSQVGRQQGAPAVGVTNEGTSQSQQDVRKAIVELIIALKQVCASPDSVWDRSKVERDLGLNWVPQAPPGNPGGA